MNHSLRTRAEHRLLEMVQAAARVFALVGYQRAQMSDIAAEANVALGTPYRYAVGKAAYFHFAVHFGFGGDPLEHAAELPVPNPSPGATIALLKEIIARRAWFPVLRAAVDAPPSEDIAQEMNAIVSEIYDSIAEHQLGIRIVDRSAREWPELAELFFEGVRQPLIDLITRYLEARCSAGVLAVPPDLHAAARFVLEGCAWFAMHRHYDATAPAFGDEGARATVTRLMTAAFIGTESRSE